MVKDAAGRFIRVNDTCVCRCGFADGTGMVELMIGDNRVRRDWSEMYRRDDMAGDSLRKPLLDEFELAFNDCNVNREHHQQIAVAPSTATSSA